MSRRREPEIHALSLVVDGVENIMPLRLEIISHQKTRLGERRIKEFGVKGGTIGRSLESDWALEDSQRYLSGRHAAIDYRSGSYYVVDTSTNGVFVNDSPTPIGRAKPQRLFNGDRLRLGEYQMVVHLDEPGPEGERYDEPDHTDPVSRAQLVDTPAPTGYSLLSEDELSALAVEEILADHTATDALKAAASSLRLLDDDPRPAPRAPSKPKTTTTDSAIRKSKAAKRTARKAAPAASPPKPAIGVADSQSQPPPTPLYAFLRGAGLANRELGSRETAMLLHRAGQLIRELALGLRRSIDARVEQKNQLRLANTTIQPQNNNLLKFAASLDEAVENLLFLQKPEYLPAVDAVREGFAEAVDHERALLQATHEALKSYLERLDPAEIQQKADDGGKRSLLGAIGDSKFRARYADIYEALAQHNPGHFPAAFGEAFAAAYERELANRTAASPSQRAKSG